MAKKKVPRRLHKSLPRSFQDAIAGFWLAFCQERNIHLQLLAGICVLVLAFLLHVTADDFIIILLLIGGVISLELVNTSIERVVDLITQERHPMAKAAKDAAAAAVWWFSVVAAIIFAIIMVNTLK
ncbi:MAG: diacylglycerol kinase family protein [Sporolactobacillus sp.]